MVELYATPRRFPRVNILGGLSGTISVHQEVGLVDLSQAGARLEHIGRFRLGSVCFLRLPGPKGEILLKARVVYSAVTRTTPGQGDEPALLYQSGVEFLDLSPEAVAALRQILATLGSPAPPA